MMETGQTMIQAQGLPSLQLPTLPGILALPCLACSSAPDSFTWSTRVKQPGAQPVVNCSGSSARISVDQVVEPQAIWVTWDFGFFADVQIEDCRCELVIDTGWDSFSRLRIWH